MTELVHYDATADGAATITLDSPHNRNALSTGLVSELGSALTRAETEESVRVIVIRSADRVFCSGADLSEASTVPMSRSTRGIVALQRQIVAFPKPVLIALDGPVRAGGIGLVAAADIVVVTPEADFALTEVKLGLAAAVISLTVTARMTSRAAAYAVLTGERFSGERAVEFGLATECVPAAELDDRIDAICAELATGHPQGLRENKKVLNRHLLAALDEEGEAMADLSTRLFGSEAAREAMTAFLQRRR